MAWVTPKINWTKTDRINYADYNRIKNNLAYLRDLAAQLYREFDITVDPDKDKYSLWPYPSEINRLEENLETIRNHTYPFTTGQRRTYYGNVPTIDWQELDRLESACKLIHDNLQGQAEGKRRLSFRLGGLRGL
ncbi:hypothetical protein [Hungatella effluvii]|uniref:hypothetical protein n=1 Tax=Hungatella effluvii TaxID=1096246 RepID=UPI002A80AB3B|nr:hypothetical protein [Hungatella effluvii]